MTITHTFVSAKADGSDASLVKPSNWNADHAITDFGGSILVASSTASDATKATALASGGSVCDGTADDVQIQAAIDALPAGEGRVVLSEGNFNIAALINLATNVCLEGQGRSTNLTPAGNNHVIVFPADSEGAKLRNVVIVDTSGLQTSTAGILLNNATGQPVWYARIEHVEIRNTYIGIATGAPAASTANGVNHGIFTDIFLHNIRSQAIKMVTFYDCILRDITVDLATIPSSLSAPNIQLVNGGEESGTWIDHLRILGRKVTYNSNLGMLIDGVRSLWLLDCFLDSCGDTCFRFNNDCHRTKLIGCRAQSGLQSGFEWWTAAAGTIEITHCSALGNEDYGFKSQAGDTSTRYILGGQSIGNTTGALTLPTGTNVVKDLQGYVNENSGTATVLNTTTTIVVNHGLATTPTRVLLTARLWSNAAKVWVTTLTTTQFTINVNADPGAGTAIFDWRAQVGEG